MRLDMNLRVHRNRLAACNSYEDEKRQLVTLRHEAVRSQVAAVTSLMETINERGLVFMELDIKRLAKRLVDEKTELMQRLKEEMLEEADELIASDQEL
jgi:hypothetical protein